MKYIPSITHTYGKILIGAADIYYNSHKMGSSDFILLYKSLKQGLFLLFYLVSFVNLKNYVSQIQLLITRKLPYCVLISILQPEIAQFKSIKFFNYCLDLSAHNKSLILTYLAIYSWVANTRYFVIQTLAERYVGIPSLSFDLSRFTIFQVDECLLQCKGIVKFSFFKWYFKIIWYFSLRKFHGFKFI